MAKMEQTRNQINSFFNIFSIPVSRLGCNGLSLKHPPIRLLQCMVQSIRCWYLGNPTVGEVGNGWDHLVDDVIFLSIG